MIRYIVATIAAASCAAADLRLTPPVDCDLGSTCFIQQYVDHDLSKGARDYRCSTLSYDTHKGTDFALRTYAQMQRGVSVLAAAPGRVRATRDGVVDRVYGGKFGEVPSNRACGNGLIIDHAGGWSTQYCHLKKGSLAVQKGQPVERGAVLGQIGMSGRAQFPHVHLTVRKDNKVVDPFDPDGQITCGAPSTQSLWATPLAYRPGGLLDVGFSNQVPAYNTVKAGTAGSPDLPADAPAIVLFGYAFGGQKGDIVQMRINGPSGRFLDARVVLEKNQAQFFRAQGKKRSEALWPTGRYVGTVRLIRSGKVVSERQSEVRIRN